MEVYSLEDECVDNMFMTQGSQNILPLVPNFDVQHDMGDEGINLTQTQNNEVTTYSDISEDEDVNIPCSQVPPVHTNTG